MCDLLERGCQRSTMKAVACLRGGDGDHLPEVSVVSEQEFIERVSSYAGDDPDERAQAEADYALWNRGLALFELAPADYDVDDLIADGAAETAAAYFPDQGDIVILDRGEPLRDAGAVEVFAHEVVHALQDQELDLATFGDSDDASFDSDLALDAIIEGEAVHYQILAAVDLAGRSVDDLDWDLLYDTFRAESLLEAEEDEAPVALADLRFPYAFGGALVTDRWRARRRAGIDALFEDPPRTTSEVMFERDALQLEDARAALALHAVPELPAPFEEQTATALGAWIARMYAVRANAGANGRVDAAQRLAADVFSVHHDAQSDTVLAAWRARMVEGTTAETWPQPNDPAVVVQRDEARREAILLAADAALPAGSEELAWRAPTDPEPSDDEAAAAAAGVMPSGTPRRAPFRACAVHPVPLMWR